MKIPAALWAVTLAGLMASPAHASGGRKEKKDLTYKDALAMVQAKVLKSSNRVAVACYRTAFVLQQGASSKSMQLLGGDGGGIKRASLNVLLGGVTPKDFQEITDKSYENFLAELKADGREVVSIDDIKKTEGYKKIDFTPLEEGKGYGKVYKVTQSKSYTVYSPSAIPLFFTHSDALGDRGSFALGNWKALWSIAKELDAIVMCPITVVNFVNLAGSGDSLVAPSVNVSAGAVVSIDPGAVSIFPFWDASGAGGAAAVKESIAIEGKFGDFDQDPNASNGYSAFPKAAGLNNVDKSAVFKADAGKYKELAIQANQKVGQYFGQLVVETKP